MKRIAEIQREYVYMLKQHLSDDLKRYLRFVAVNDDNLRSLHVNPENTSDLIILSSSGSTMSSSAYRVRELLNDVRRFWVINGDELLSEMKNLPGFCAFSDTESIVASEAKRYALYFDTICYPDQLFPIARSLESQDVPAPILSNLVRGKFLAVLLLEPLLLVDTDHPAVIVFPDPFDLRTTLDSNYPETSGFLSSYRESVLDFFEDTFQHRFTPTQLSYKLEKSFDEPTLNQLTANQYICEMAGSSDLKGLATRYLFQSTIQSSKSENPEFPRLHIGREVFGAIRTKLFQQQRIHRMSEELLVDPMLDVLSWPVYKWHIERTAKTTIHRFAVSEELAAIRMLSRPSLKWLGNVSIEELQEVRQDQKLIQLRSLFGLHKKKIKLAKLEELDTVIRDAENELNEALTQHEADLSSIASKVARRKNLTISSFIVSGSLAIASLAFPYLSLLSLLSAGFGLATGSSVYNLIDEYVSGSKSKKEIISRPIGILWNVKQRDGKG